MAAFFGSGNLTGADGKTVEIPAAWDAAWKWLYDATWKDHITMTGPVFESEEYNGGGYSFCSGKVAMQVNWLWSNYCLLDEEGKEPAGSDWDLAPAPSYQGTTTAPFNADTFRILSDSKHPKEAFEALTYLLGEGSADLLTAYGGMPARTADQPAFMQGLETQFPHGADWQVAVDSIEYADNPNFEAYMPAYNETLDRLGTFMTKLTSEDGVDVGAEIATLKSDLQAIWDRSQ
jgi:multiple sugar transport system substrate-binding protein